MTATLFAGLIRAETTKLLSRTSARAGLVLSAGLGLVIPLLYALFYAWRVGADLTVNGAPMDVGEYQDPVMVLGWVLYVRNAYLMRIVIAALAALSFAGERASHTLRDDLLRPVPRWAVLLAKLAALAVFVLLSTVMTGLVAAVFAIGLYGFGAGSWAGVLLGYIVTAITDVVFAAMALAVAVWVRSVAMTLVAIVIGGAVEAALYAGLLALEKGISLMQGVSPTTSLELPAVISALMVLREWMPTSALWVWLGYLDEVAWSVGGFGSLFLLAMGSVIVAIVGFRIQDVP